MQMGNQTINNKIKHTKKMQQGLNKMNYGYGTMCGKSWKKRVSEMKRRKLENYIFGGCMKQTMGCMR